MWAKLKNIKITTKAMIAKSHVRKMKWGYVFKEIKETRDFLSFPTTINFSW